MRILIVVGTSLRYCPYANFYIDLLKEENIDFDVVYPDKEELHDVYYFSTFVYNWDKKKNKYIELMNYKRFVLDLVKKTKYDYAILLTTVLTIMFYLSLKRKKIKYIVDIRDYTHEDLIPFFWAERNAIKKATCCVISSPGFRRFLPDHSYIDVFNAPKDLELKSKQFYKNNGYRPIRISYIGTIAYPDQCEKLMNLVESDERFEFALYGNDLNGERISTYINNRDLKRSKYYGPYNPRDKGEIIQEADILFNAYGNDSPLLLYALSNKLTDAAMYLKPVLNSPGTCMHEILGACSYAIDLKTEKDLDSLYQWYCQLDTNHAYEKLKDLLALINATNSKCKSEICKYFKEK